MQQRSEVENWKNYIKNIKSDKKEKIYIKPKTSKNNQDYQSHCYILHYVLCNTMVSLTSFLY